MVIISNYLYRGSYWREGAYSREDAYWRFYGIGTKWNKRDELKRLQTRELSAKMEELNDSELRHNGKLLVTSSPRRQECTVFIATYYYYLGI